jgi:hypothetical protein
MLHNTQLTVNKDESQTITTSLFVNRAALPNFNLAGVTAKAVTRSAGGGINAVPGADAEIFVEVTIPRSKAAEPVKKPEPGPAPKPGTIAAPALVPQQHPLSK